ncbi:MAG: hypothetical protein J6F33_02060 [Acidaminococcaceae bacterium]|nr:hypothetical protein [Acidaminococcaceae bacterium]
MTTTRKSVSKETDKNEKVIYVGPSLSSGRLAFSTIYIGGLPDHINAIVADNPWFSQLFVPIGKMNEAIAETKKKGSALYTLYKKAMEV